MRLAIAPLLHQKQPLVQLLFALVLAILQLPQRFNAVNHIRPCDILPWLSRWHLFAVHQVIQLLQISLKLGAEQVEGHKLVNNRRALFIEVIECAAQVQPHAIERRNGFGIYHIEDRINDLLHRAHVILDAGHSHIHNAFHLNLYPVKVRHALASLLLRRVFKFLETLLHRRLFHNRRVKGDVIIQIGSQDPLSHIGIQHKRLQVLRAFGDNHPRFRLFAFHLGDKRPGLGRVERQPKL